MRITTLSFSENTSIPDEKGGYLPSVSDTDIARAVAEVCPVLASQIDEEEREAGYLTMRHELFCRTDRERNFLLDIYQKDGTLITAEQHCGDTNFFNGIGNHPEAIAIFTFLKKGVTFITIFH